MCTTVKPFAGYFLIPLLFLLLPTPAVRAQDTLQANRDSVSPFVQKVIRAANADREKSSAAFKEGLTAIRQRAVCNKLIRTAQEVKLYLNAAPDTAAFKKSLQAATAAYKIARDGIFTNKGTTQTERNLSVSSVVLNRLIADVSARKKQIDQHSANLSRFRTRLDSLLSDPVIYAFPADSASLLRYLKRLRVIAREGNPSDNALNQAMIDVDALQNQTDGLLLDLTASYDDVETLRKDLASISLKRELPDIWAAAKHYRPLSEILHYSYAKEKMAFRFYLRSNLYLIWLLVLLAALLYRGHRSLGKKITAKNDADAEKLIVRHPLGTAVFIVASLSQFLFITAPFIFSICIWLIAIVSLITFARGYITAYWLRFWIVTSLLFLTACANNLILQASRTERWVMFCLSVAGVVYGLSLLASRHRHALKEKTIVVFIRFLVIAEALSLLLNIFGRYNTAKILLNVGYTGIVVGIIFIWLTRLLSEQLSLGQRFYRNTDSKTSLLWLHDIGTKMPILLYGIFGLSWLVIVGRQFYLFNRIFEPLKAFLHAERTIGSYSFSVNGIFLFIAIMLFSLMLSRLISFLADYRIGTARSAGTGLKGLPIGSWVLLARIIIISVGVFLAFAASGLPLDRLTIVLGALGVGIGLGLQSLVSNLVSGLIIAFEKPVNVGDLVEINGKTGHMRSIGFRSSIVALTNGASLVVPNGDILNTHVVNWSLSKGSKQLRISVGVAYGSDLAQVKSVLEAAAGQCEAVLPLPKPNAVATKFSDSAVSFDLIFWASTFNETAAVHNLIAAVDAAFKANGIVIPLPQAEVHWTPPAQENEATA
ncbi:MAG: mechanosensitive ion channel [Chitinophagaceae bacterium]|nr:mechanosensitive ion channel [Chitinophagaceae bacterium]